VGGGGFNIGVIASPIPHHIWAFYKCLSLNFFQFGKIKTNCQKGFSCDNLFSFFFSLAKFSDLAKKKFQNGY
jgi:hypothetical protein